MYSKCQRLQVKEVNRCTEKYKDFEWLRHNLTRMFPGVFIPPLPTKNLLGSITSLGSDKFESLHRFEIERFVNRLATIPIIVNSPPFQAFINNTGNFDDASKDLDKKVDNRNRDELLKIYSDFFPKQMSYALPQHADQLLGSFLDFLHKCEKNMAESFDTATALSQNVTTQVQHLTKMNLLVPFIYSIEHGYPHPAPARVDISTTFQQWLDCLLHIETANNTNLLQAFNFDLQDIRSFIELLKHRQEVFNELSKASAKAKKWKSSDALVNTDKLKKEKEADLKKEEELTGQLNSMTKLILFEQTQSFWAQKTKNFQASIAAFAKANLEACRQLTTIFHQLAEKAEATI